MIDTGFFTNQGPFSIEAITTLTGATWQRAANSQEQDAMPMLQDVAPLDRANAAHISFFDNPKYIDQFTASEAGVCFVRPKYANKAPAHMHILVTDDPYRAYALTAQQFYPVDHMRNRAEASTAVAPKATIHPTARIGKDTVIATGAVIGEHVVIGEHCHIGTNSVIHNGVRIGDHTTIGALSSVSHAHIGSHVLIHRGVHIGQDGFGFALGRGGHVKVPQLGRVIVQDYVEIGSNTCIDRGAGPDTIIGEGTKIDNLVQIGHNVRIDPHAVIISQTGISGSTHIGAGAILAGQTGIAGHLTIGAGARIAAQSGVMADVPTGAAYGGSPAVPIKQWHRQTLTLSRLANPNRGTHDND